MKKYALIAGVSDYSLVNNLINLPGSKNDIINIKHILSTFYKFDVILSLLNENATSDSIKAELINFKNQLETGDLLFFYYSGHGSQIREVKNSEEFDFLDEVLCLFDMDWKTKYISDDWFANFAQSIPNECAFEIVLDCCFSGDFSDDISTKFGIAPEYFEAEFDPTRKTIPVSFYTSLTKSNIVLWTASASEQEAKQKPINGISNSIFTYCLCESILESKNNFSRKDIFDNTCKKIKLNYGQQTPTLSISDSLKLKHFLTF